jgi:hypothetical protein
MESAKKQFNVEDYAIHQATLEQVFLAFTRNQVAQKEESKDGIWQNIIRILHLYNKCKDCRINYDMYTVETLPQTGISVIRKDRNGSPIVYI